MRGLVRAALLGLLCFLTVSVGMAQTVTGPGTVQYTLDRPDGTRVSLAMVVVGAVNAGGVSVHEWWDKTSPIAAVFAPPPGLSAGQTIDLEGWMATLPNGRRAILCERIAFYLDPHGLVLSIIPPLKGTLDPSIWPSRDWIPVAPPQSGFQTLSLDGGITVLEDVEPPPGTNDPPTPVVASLTAGTIPYAKSRADDQPVTLSGEIVTAGTGQIYGCIYIEEPDRSCGIRVVPTSESGSFAVGDKVDVTGGTMSTNADGERYIASAPVTKMGTQAIKPIGLVHRNIGGGPLMYDQTVLQQGVYGGLGMNNIGLLVKTWGKVTTRDTSGQFFYINDGTAPSDGSGYTGLRVQASAGTLLPAVGATLEVTGIGSCRVLNDNVVRVLRARSQEDTPVVIYVKLGGAGNRDGTSWANAMASVQTALDSPSGTEIWVAAGTYNEKVTLRVGRRLYGGFVGNELRRGARSISFNVTTLDATGKDGPVVTCEPGATSSTIIDGFTIQNGIGELVGAYRYGGGVYCLSSSPTISSNTITNNSASYGGGICCDSSSPKISNNRITGNVGGGIFCGSSSPTISNNTITSNNGHYGGGVYGLGSYFALSNNLIAFNNSGIFSYSGNPVLKNNCVFDNTAYNYSGISAGDEDISADPRLAEDSFHLLPGSPCINAGYSAAVQAGWLDIDGEPRINGPRVDIGADEYYHRDGCIWYRPKIEANPALVEIEDTRTITVTVTDPVTGEPVSGRRVDFAITDGELVSAYNDDSGTWTPDNPPTTGHGITGANRKVYAQVTRETAGQISVTARVSNSCETGNTSESISAWFCIRYRVGFIYDLYEPNFRGPDRDDVDAYLRSVVEADTSLTYQQITGTPCSIDASFNTVFICMPWRDLQPSEISALSTFVQSGRNKRIVLVGEYNPDFSTHNSRLNTIAAALGMNSQFSTSGTSYDCGDSRGRICEVESSHYLAAGVTGLWMACTSTFASGWEAYARPLAYTAYDPTPDDPNDANPAWIIEEDTAAAGSRILIHDSNIFGWPDYGDDYDTVPDKNVLFIRNLCTRFPE